MTERETTEIEDMIEREVSRRVEGEVEKALSRLRVSIDDERAGHKSRLCVRLTWKKLDDYTDPITLSEDFVYLSDLRTDY